MNNKCTIRYTLAWILVRMAKLDKFGNAIHCKRNDIIIWLLNHSKVTPQEFREKISN